MCYQQANRGNMNFQNTVCFCVLYPCSKAKDTFSCPFTEEKTTPILSHPHQKRNKFQRKHLGSLQLSITAYPSSPQKNFFHRKPLILTPKGDPSSMSTCLGAPDQGRHRYLTYFSRNMLATEAKACCDIEAVHRLQTIMALRSCDIDGCWQKN